MALALKGAARGLLRWLSDIRAIASLHNQLTRSGVRVHAIRPVSDGSYVATIHAGSDASDVESHVRRDGYITSDAIPVARVGSNSYLWSVNYRRAA